MNLMNLIQSASTLTQDIPSKQRSIWIAQHTGCQESPLQVGANPLREMVSLSLYIYKTEIYWP